MHSQSEEKKEPKQILIALLLSLSLHLALLLTLNLEVAPRKIKKIIELELRPKKVEEKKQIISQSLAKEEVPKKKTNLLSEKNSSTKLEQVKRGEIEGAEIRQAEERELASKKTSSGLGKNRVKATTKIPAKPQEAPPKKAPLVLASKLGAEDLPTKTNSAEKSAKTEDKNPNKQAPSSEQKEQEIQKKLRDYRPFSKNFAGFSSLRLGSPDFLPNIQDGEVTLLNAKAERFAIFVRRVAYQVFGSLRRFSWQELSGREIASLSSFSTVLATLDRSGKLLELEITNPSGSSRFDDMLLKAAKNGAWDKNPPSGAEEEDGKIYFTFKARSWVKFPDQGFGEQRWLLLSTGLGLRSNHSRE